MSSADIEISGCCADALLAHYAESSEFVRGLGDASELKMWRRERLFNGVIPYAFPGMDATRRPLPEFETKLLRTPIAQDWVLALGCQNVLTGMRPQAYIDGLDAIAAGQSCADEAYEAHDVSQWKDICTVWASAPERSVHLCGPIETEAQLTALRVANALVYNAIGAYSASEFNTQIILGAHAIAANKGEYTDAINLMKRAFDPSRLPPGADPRMRHAAREFHANTGLYSDMIKEFTGTNDLPKTDQMVQKLQEAMDQRQWSEIKPHTRPDQRKEYQEQMDNALKQAEASGMDPDSPALDILR